MNKTDLHQWKQKNLKLNVNTIPFLGMIVKDHNGDKGIVVKIVPSSEDFHGTVYVWQEDKSDYGSDNCEHYSYTNWHEHLRVIS